MGKIPSIFKLVEDKDYISGSIGFNNVPPDSFIAKYGIDCIALSSVVLNKYCLSPLKHSRYPDEIALMRKNLDELRGNWELIYRENPSRILR